MVEAKKHSEVHKLSRMIYHMAAFLQLHSVTVKALRIQVKLIIYSLLNLFAIHKSSSTVLQKTVHTLHWTSLTL